MSNWVTQYLLLKQGWGSVGNGLLIQSNAKTPSYLNTRYQQFYLQALEKLKKLPIDEFNQYKQYYHGDESTTSNIL